MRISFSTTLIACILGTTASPAAAALGGTPKKEGNPVQQDQRRAQGAEGATVQENHGYYNPGPYHGQHSFSYYKPRYQSKCCNCPGEKTFVPSTTIGTWGQHLITARSMGCELASISNQKENDEVQAFAETFRFIAAGDLANDQATLTNQDLGVGKFVFVGLARPFTEEDGWEWSDGCTNFVFTNWCSNTGGDNCPGGVDEPNNGQVYYKLGTETVVGMLLDREKDYSGKWFDFPVAWVGHAVYECCVPDGSCSVDLEK